MATGQLDAFWNAQRKSQGEGLEAAGYPLNAAAAAPAAEFREATFSAQAADLRAICLDLNVHFC